MCRSASNFAEQRQTYWSRFIEARHEVMTETMTLLCGFMDQDPDNGHVSSALDSLAAAESQLDTITSDLCVNFLDAWRDDLDDWQRFSNGVNNVGSTREAMDFLELKTWTRAEFGAAVVDSETAPGSAQRPVGVRCLTLAAARTAQSLAGTGALRSARSRAPRRRAVHRDCPPAPKAADRSLPSGAPSRLGRAARRGTPRVGDASAPPRWTRGIASQVVLARRPTGPARSPSQPHEQLSMWRHRTLAAIPARPTATRGHSST